MRNTTTWNFFSSGPLVGIRIQCKADYYLSSISSCPQTIFRVDIWCIRFLVPISTNVPLPRLIEERIFGKQISLAEVVNVCLRLETEKVASRRIALSLIWRTPRNALLAAALNEDTLGSLIYSAPLRYMSVSWYKPESIKNCSTCNTIRLLTILRHGE